MKNTAGVNTQQRKAFFDTDNLASANNKVKIPPISENEADETEFKSLKGIAGKPLNSDDIRKERLKKYR